jgi:hypothetical protein
VFDTEAIKSIDRRVGVPCCELLENLGLISIAFFGSMQLSIDLGLCEKAFSDYCSPSGSMVRFLILLVRSPSLHSELINKEIHTIFLAIWFVFLILIDS